MAKRGPRPKLDAMDILDGRPNQKKNHQRKKLMAVLGVEALGEPFVAEHLVDDARGCIEVIKKSMPPRIYSALDSFLLAAFGMSWAIHKRCAIEVSSPDFSLVVTAYNADGHEDEESGEWVEPTVRSTRANPVLGIMKEHAILMASIGDRLGLDPKSRQGLSIQGSQQQGRQSKFAGLTTPRPRQVDEQDPDQIGEGRSDH